MVPVLATGFGDVLKRMEMQDIQLDAHKKTMMVRMMMREHGLGRGINHNIYGLGNWRAARDCSTKVHAWITRKA